MTPEEQKRFLPILESMQRDLLRNARRAVRGEVHFDKDDAADELDNASSENDRGFISKLRDRERSLINKIQIAVAKIEAGTYGVCIECEEPIRPSRLEARPVAELCIDCKAEEERSRDD